MNRYILSFGLVLCIALTSSCSLAPVSKRPKVDIPQTYKENNGKWLRADTKIANNLRGAWWEIYKDKDLNILEAKIAVSNNNLKAAVARYYESSALADQARAQYFPMVTLGAGAQRAGISKTTSILISPSSYNDFLLGGYLSYEIDIWGKVRNMVKSATAQAKASAADLAFMDVSLHAELAMNYFALRGDDASQIVLDKIVNILEKELRLIKARHVGGIVAEADVEQAKVQLQNAKTQAADMHIKRAQLEHAIAVLVGEVPSGFSIEAKKTRADIPTPEVPAISSTLLEKRPDIAASCLRVEAANANIGVARAAYFPDFTFNTSMGVETSLLKKLIFAPSLIWSFGPLASAPLFEGGRIRALNKQARAAYDEAVANYRQTVLTAFQEVEDGLVATRQLEREDMIQRAALRAARRVLAQAIYRYDGGIATPIEVITAQNAELQSEMASINITTSRLATSALLVKALGGGWHAD
ncbi:outer membrane protein, multidrug efflux system [Gammaproteobacteria bacterium]